MVSDQIISVVNDLCDKFGIAIDWSQKNIHPYLEELMHKAVNYKFCTSVMWLVVGILLAFLSAFISFKLYKRYKEYDNYNDYDEDEGMFRLLLFLIVFGLLIISITTILVNIGTMITCKTFPEKIVFDMLSHYLK